MKVIEILKLNSGLLKVLQDTGIKVEDVRYIGLHDEYRRMQANGEKVSYIVATLAERYGICERKVYSLIKHLSRDCKLHTV